MSKIRLPRINYVVLSGRLTKDVELRFTPNGTPIAKLSLALNRSYQKNGEWQQETSYIDIIAWSDKGEKASKTLTKGSPIIVEGYIKTGSYQDKEGNNRKVTEIVAERLSPLEWLELDVDEDEPNEDTHGAEGSGVDGDDDDVPF